MQGCDKRIVRASLYCAAAIRADQPSVDGGAFARLGRCVSDAEQVLSVWGPDRKADSRES